MLYARRILIGDRQPVTLSGLSHYLRNAGYDLIGTANSVGELTRAVDRLSPDMLVTDCAFRDGQDGPGLISRLRRLAPSLKIVVFSDAWHISTVRQLLSNGADAFVSKDATLDQVAAACEAVQADLPFVDSTTQQLLEAACDTPAGKSAKHMTDPEGLLSPREREVLQLLARGLSIRDIAGLFHRSAKTVSVQKCAAMSKLGLSQDIELAVYLSKRPSFVGGMVPKALASGANAR